MKQKFVPYEKMSKKARREFDKQKRIMWEVPPMTRSFLTSIRKEETNKDLTFLKKYDIIL